MRQGSIPAALPSVSLICGRTHRASATATQVTLDPRRAKELHFVVERRFNDAEGRLAIDDVELARRATPLDRGPEDDDEFLDEVARAAFRFFWDYAHPKLGWVPDRSQWHNSFHPVGVGFQLGTMVVGAERGYVTRRQAADRVRLILSSFVKLPQGPGVLGVAGYRGHFYHFLDYRALREGRNSAVWRSFASNPEIRHALDTICGASGR